MLLNDPCDCLVENESVWGRGGDQQGWKLDGQAVTLGERMVTGTVDRSRWILGAPGKGWVWGGEEEEQVGDS